MEIDHLGKGEVVSVPLVLIHIKQLVSSCLPNNEEVKACSLAGMDLSEGGGVKLGRRFAGRGAKNCRSAARHRLLPAGSALLYTRDCAYYLSHDHPQPG